MHTGGHFGCDKGHSEDLLTILLEEYDRGDQIVCSHLWAVPKNESKIQEITVNPSPYPSAA